VDDDMPAFNSGKQRTRFAGHIARAAQAVATYIKAPGC